MIRSGTFVAVASLIVSMHAGADNRALETQPATPSVASDMSDADVLAERHLALYRASRAAVLGLRDFPAEDSTPVIVRTSATAPLPLPQDEPLAGVELSAQ